MKDIIKLPKSTIDAIEDALSHRKSLEIRVERDKIVLIELNRKVKDKSVYAN